MAAKVIRGQRYRTAENEWLAQFTLNDLPYLDYKETCAWYASREPKGGQTLTKSQRALLGCNDRYYLLTGLLDPRERCNPGCFDAAARGEPIQTVILICGPAYILNRP